MISRIAFASIIMLLLQITHCIVLLNLSDMSGVRTSNIPLDPSWSLPWVEELDAMH